MVVVAVVLAACQPAPTPTPTPRPTATTEPTLAATTEATPEASAVVTTEATTEVTSAATTESTAEVTAAATTEATAEVTAAATTESTAEMTAAATAEMTAGATTEATAEATQGIGILPATIEATTEATAEMTATSEVTAELGTIIEVAKADGHFTTLLAALDKAGLTDTLNGTGPFTVFAPTDDAFQAMLTATNMTAGDLLDNPDLANILKYHVVSGKVTADDLQAFKSQDNPDVIIVPTLDGDKTITITFAADGTITLNGTAKVTLKNVEASNGIIHVIDAVLMPPTDATPEATMAIMATTEATAEMTAAATEAMTEVAMVPTTMAATTEASPEATMAIMATTEATAEMTIAATEGVSTPEPTMAPTTEATIEMTATTEATAEMTPAATVELGTIIEVAKADGHFTTLLAALDKADLTDTLNGTGPFTVFAPTDEAFQALLTATNMTAGDLLDNPDLAKILEYHVVKGKFAVEDIQALHNPNSTDALLIPTLDDDKFLTIRFGDDGTITINDTAKLTLTNIQASNGVIHVIDAMLMPPTDATAEAAAAATPAPMRIDSPLAAPTAEVTPAS